MPGRQIPSLRYLLLGSTLCELAAGTTANNATVPVPGIEIAVMSPEEVAALHEAQLDARRLQTSSAGVVLTLGAAATTKTAIGTGGASITYSWYLPDSTLQHTITFQDYKTGLTVQSGNLYRIQIGATSTLTQLAFSEPSNGSFQCCSGTPCTCRTYNVKPGGNAVAAWDQKQAQGYGQNPSWMYMTITCLNTLYSCQHNIRVAADYSPSPTPSNTPTGSITPSTSQT